LVLPQETLFSIEFGSTWTPQFARLASGIWIWRLRIMTTGILGGREETTPRSPARGGPLSYSNRSFVGSAHPPHHTEPFLFLFKGETLQDLALLARATGLTSTNFGNLTAGCVSLLNFFLWPGYTTRGNQAGEATNHHIQTGVWWTGLGGLMASCCA